MSNESIRWELPRLRAVFRKCLLVHPEAAGCECLRGQCILKKMCKTTGDKLRCDLSEISEMESELSAVPATVRSDWVKPIPPDVGYFLAVINDGGKWHPHWYSDSHQVDYLAIEGPASWPFIEEAARTRDWQKLGFTVFAP